MGRTLVECYHRHESDMAAWEAGRAYRVAFWAIADQIDNRQGRAV